MKKLFTLITAILLCLNLSAQDVFNDEQVVISPDVIHLYWHGCSPHGDVISISNLTSEDLVINRFYAEHFNVECLYEGQNIAEVGAIVGIGETILLDFYASPTAKDLFGTLYIDTDFGMYIIGLYYESVYSLEEQHDTFNLVPNPANGFVTIKGMGIGQVSIFNMLGQKIDDLFVEGEEATISTAHYPNGIYVAKIANGETRRFVVAH